MPNFVFQNSKEMKEMQNILVAVDFGDGDHALLDSALQMALKFNAKIWIVHVAAPDPDFVGYEPGPQYIRDGRADDLKSEHKTLHTYAEQMKNAGLQAEGLLIQGQTVETILEEAAKLKADLFVVGTHRHGFFHRLLSANAPLELAKKSKIPLLIVPLD
jgi:nucleotide-binding universal stress UspA family protein